jgi:hypothetical protein
MAQRGLRSSDSRLTRATMLINDRTDALLAKFPGPLTIGFSARKYLLALACGGVFVAVGAAFILLAEPFAATAATSHGAPPLVGILRLLVLLRVAHDMPEAFAEFGWFVLVFGGARRSTKGWRRPAPPANRSIARSFAGCRGSCSPVRHTAKGVRRRRRFVRQSTLPNDRAPSFCSAGRKTVCAAGRNRTCDR